MTIPEYIEALQKLHEEYPNAHLVFSSDDDGNEFHKVFYGPTPGMHDEDESVFYAYNLDRDSDLEPKEFEKCFKPEQVNAICIN